ncbi:hypothetical protein JKP88DRAFT_245031 [Tribonema minus]|uniref:Uncharacterized protein n=1 Tax=Tribonema minus TaxID=303371 RepID=A0A836CFQ3_9STRA|nr:hypothetical protein JKP88DRAFT_245031 [Tribonema minus]
MVTRSYVTQEAIKLIFKFSMLSGAAHSAVMKTLALATLSRLAWTHPLTPDKHDAACATILAAMHEHEGHQDLHEGLTDAFVAMAHILDNLPQVRTCRALLAVRNAQWRAPSATRCRALRSSWRRCSAEEARHCTSSAPHMRGLASGSAVAEEYAERRWADRSGTQRELRLLGLGAAPATALQMSESCCTWLRPDRSGVIELGVSHSGGNTATCVSDLASFVPTGTLRRASTPSWLRANAGHGLSGTGGEPAARGERAAAAVAAATRHHDGRHAHLGKTCAVGCSGSVSTGHNGGGSGSGQSTFAGGRTDMHAPCDGGGMHVIGCCRRSETAAESAAACTAWAAETTTRTPVAVTVAVVGTLSASARAPCCSSSACAIGGGSWGTCTTDVTAARRLSWRQQQHTSNDGGAIAARVPTAALAAARYMPSLELRRRSLWQAGGYGALLQYRHEVVQVLATAPGVTVSTGSSGAGTRNRRGNIDSEDSSNCCLDAQRHICVGDCGHCVTRRGGSECSGAAAVAAAACTAAYTWVLVNVALAEATCLTSGAETLASGWDNVCASSCSTAAASQGLQLLGGGHGD